MTHPDAPSGQPYSGPDAPKYTRGPDGFSPPAPGPMQQNPDGTWSPAVPYPPQQQNSGLAITSLVLGISGLIVSWFTFGIPSLLALIFGIIGIRQTGPGKRAGRGMAVVGTVLGGVVLALGVWVSAALVYSFGSAASTASSSANSAAENPMPAIPSEQAEANASASNAPPAPPAEESGDYTPTAKDFKVTVRVTSKQCFGDAGCLVDYKVSLAYGGEPLNSDKSYDVTYHVAGPQDGGQDDTITVTGDSYDQPLEQSAQTPSSATKLVAKVTSVDES